ncbi:hypothetical protein KsCSTR_46830 [Candidatus Kuenenia stuttgartiensis]|uniref:Uncharacterized protein n=1 Tax=Kuenenia stuttgartiensis TaxID=174633 RepID=Q1PW54_KUEST|nr:hypothetical protein KsCSTR_46830 [Candidatus Kuenenia stuttgartiensis]CAJ71453.1 unknown protein [Candidatus Kuenenia stuttgartiensis]
MHGLSITKNAGQMREKRAGISVFLPIRFTGGRSVIVRATPLPLRMKKSRRPKQKRCL